MTWHVVALKESRLTSTDSAKAALDAREPKDVAALATMGRWFTECGNAQPHRLKAQM